MTEKQFDKRLSEQPSAGESGFSMIEMMIAIVVVTFGLVSIVGISVYVSRANSTSAALNVLANAGQDQVDRLRTARWTATVTDPMLSIGGAVPAVASMSGSEPTILRVARPNTAYLLTAPTTDPSSTSSPTTATSVGATYTYTLDPLNPHRATASGTSVGDLNITWQVRQGAVDNVRYVTINVTQVNATPTLRSGFTVTTMIVKN